MYKPSEIYISTSNVDIRKGLDGFVSIVEQQFQLNPMSSAMFVFHNRHCDKIKILFWDSDGFCLLYKRIECGKFRFPRGHSGDTYTVSKEELNRLMHGLQIEDIRHYKSLSADSNYT